MNDPSRRDPGSPSSSSSTLASGSQTRSKPINRTASPGSSPKHEHHHMAPPIPVTTLDEGPEGLKTVVPPIPLGLGGAVPDDVDEDEKRADTSGGVETGRTGDVESGRPQKDIFDRFSPRRKYVIVGIVAYCAFLCPITSAIFLPSIPQIAEELNTSSSTIAYTVAIFIVVMGAAPLIWSPLSGFYGRRLVYITSLPILVAASVGVALSPNIGALIATRILQAIGGSCVLAVGAGSIGDIYRPTERGTAMGWYYSGNLMGPTFAPVFGGLFSQYTKLGWRSAQYFVAGLGALACALVIFVLPETSHPPTPHEKMKASTGKRFVIYRFNPLTSLGLFRWINVCAMSMSSAAVLLSIYTLLVPMSTLFKDRYHISNLAILGCLYLPSGIGNLIGARIAGPLADRTVKKYLAKRGYRRTEDRLRASIPWSLFMPVTLIAYGWLVHTGAGGIAAPLVISVLPSASLMGILTPQNTYLIDSMPTRSAEVIAVNNFLRYLGSAAASAWVLPMSERIGWGWTMTVSAALVWCSSLVLIATLKWGEGWRDKANQKYHYEGTPPDCRRPVDSITSSTTQVGSETGSDHGENEEVGHLPVSVPITERRGRRTGADKRDVAEMQGQMPPVHEVLKRTVSLSGASVHGGG